MHAARTALLIKCDSPRSSGTSVRVCDLRTSLLDNYIHGRRSIHHQHFCRARCLLSACNTSLHRACCCSIAAPSSCPALVCARATLMQGHEWHSTAPTATARIGTTSVGLLLHLRPVSASPCVASFAPASKAHEPHGTRLCPLTKLAALRIR
jgi:hypothetical protein